MAELLDNVKIQLGRVIRVKNLNAKKGEASTYVSIQVEDVDGNNERCLLFTENELNSCPILDISWDLVTGRIYPYSNTRYDGYLLKTLIYNTKRDEWYTVVRRLTKTKLNIAEIRANKNPEDLTHKSWFVDLLD